MLKNVGQNDRGGLKDVKKNEERGLVTGARAFQMTIEEAKDKLDVVLGTFTLNSLHVYVVFDSGATFSFVSSQFSEKIKIPLIPLEDKIK